MQAFAALGGLSSGLFAVLTSLSTAITHRIVIYKFIKQFYSDEDGLIYALKENSDTLEIADIDENQPLNQNFTIYE